MFLLAGEGDSSFNTSRTWTISWLLNITREEKNCLSRTNAIA